MAKYVKTEEGYKEIEAINSNKMDKNNPVGTGSFSMGRKYGSLIGLDSHAEGNNTTASGPYSHAEGYITTASGSGSHAEGYRTTASGVDSHAEGISTTASGEYSHAEGSYTIASGFDSHAEGYNTTASGNYSHAEGYNTTASGNYSHAEGKYTKASGTDSHVEGKYNIEDSSDKYAHIVGNGTSGTSRSNAHTLDWNGVGWFKNSVKVGGSSQDDSTAKTLATTDYVDTTVSTKISGKQDTLIQSGASVGQIAKITAVDDSGKPTAWEAVDMSSGSGDVGVGKQRLIADITLTEPVKSILIDMDMDGNQLSLTDVDMFAYVATNAETSYDYATVVVNGFNAFSSSNFGISTTKKTVSCFFRLREDGTASAVRSQQNQWNNYNGVDVLSSLAGSADANTGKNYGDTIRSVGIKHVGGATEALLATGTRFIVWGR